jgi:hypothetical protein
MYNKTQRTKENQNAVIGSPILAKAVTRLHNGRFELIVVFAHSTRLEFFWRFQARSPRSPRRSWKLAGYSPRDLPYHYYDFSSYVAHQAQLHGSQVLSVRMPQRRRLAALKVKTAHESIYSNWSPNPTVATFERKHGRQGYGPKGRRSIWAS